MPPKKRPRLGIRDASAARMTNIRAAETEEAREERLEANRRNNEKARAQETEEEKKYRLEAKRRRSEQVRVQETEEEKKDRLEAERRSVYIVVFNTDVVLLLKAKLQWAL